MAEKEFPQADAVASPVPVAIAADGSQGNPLLSGQGYLIRQDRQCNEWALNDCLGLWCVEYDNKYELAPLSNQHALKSLNDNTGWKPTQKVIDTVPKTLVNTESSERWTKCALMTGGCGSCRPFKMDLTQITGDSGSYMHIDREFALGGCLCMPHNAIVMVGGQPVARVIEDWNSGNWLSRYCEAACCCRIPYKIQLPQNNTYADRYNINVNFCACGPHMNLCGSTPCCNDYLWDITEVGTGANAGRIQKTYGTCGDTDACLRWAFCHADNFMVEWEDKTTLEERAGMMAATTLIEYVFFEQRIALTTILIFSALSGAT